MLPEFGLIIDILTVDRTPYFCCDCLDTVCFNHHFHSFEVTQSMPSKVEIIKHSHLTDYHPLTNSHIPSDPNSKFVCMKYHIVENQNE